MAGNFASYLEDSSGYRGSAEKVFLPASIEELRQIVEASAKERIPITVAGAGTGLVGARVPHGGWVVSLEKFRTLEIEKGRARCGVGATLNELQREAAKTRQFFGPNPTESSAAIGGIISTNAGGARSFHYGSVRRHILALEVMFADGRLAEFQRGELVNFPFTPVRQPRTTKNSAGYLLQENLEWIDLLSGSEGTLAIVTRVDLQLFPEPPAILGALIFFRSDDRALDAVTAWRSVSELRLLEFLDEGSLKLLRPAYPDIPQSAGAALLIEQNLESDDSPESDAWLDRMHDHEALANQSWFGLSAADRERFGELRHLLPTIVVDHARRNRFPKYGTDFAVPLGRTRDLHDYYRKRCEQDFPGQYVIFGHVGDANNHLNLLSTNLEQANMGIELMKEFARYVVDLGGTVAAEHGIGKTKTDLLKLMYNHDEIEHMKDVKRRLDPDWLLGRGTIFEI